MLLILIWKYFHITETNFILDSYNLDLFIVIEHVSNTRFYGANGPT
jgi:hypothetical protein